MIFARVLQDCYNAFIRLYKALTRCLQRFHNVFYNAFTRLSESVCSVFLPGVQKASRNILESF